ncbi:MAG: hypothetical protein JWO86_6079 [Myxococcaceae bacterium]|jgi:hypothetical protein|nr:hypothetical protein [Myxococcaceae bacterium]MEA2749976.1 hypothetical protein [Myxococcales bacterium]
MIDRARSVLLIVGLLVGASGCSARMAVIAHEKQAYMVKESALGFNSDMFFCDATGGKPVCRKIVEGE